MYALYVTTADGLGKSTAKFAFDDEEDSHPFLASLYHVENIVSVISRLDYEGHALMKVIYDSDPSLN